MSERRQPVHTVYGGAQLFRADTTRRLGQHALAALDEHGRDAPTFAAALGVPEEVAAAVWERVRSKLQREPVEDFRIDFEDGYGNRPDAEEDAHAVSAAREVAAGLREGTLPPAIGIRVKPFGGELEARSARTVELFVRTLAEASGSRLPEGFVVTLPKVAEPEQAERFAARLAAVEQPAGLTAGTLSCELMIELPEAIFDGEGRAHPPRLVAACGGRCVAAHFGTYDYTAAVGVTAAEQRMDHPACDFAKHVMQVSLARSGVWLSDGATNVLPVGPHRAAPDGPPLGAEQEEANRRAVHAAWRLHADHVRHSLVGGFYQGWDLHPAQLPSRYGTVYAFYLAGAAAAGERLANFVEQAARATLVGGVFDDAATGQGLLNFFLRALGCGALEVEEVERLTGLRPAELATRSFVAILAGRGAAVAGADPVTPG